MARLVPGYSSTIAEEALKNRYAEKLKLVGGIESVRSCQGQLARRRGLVVSNHAISGVHVL